MESTTPVGMAKHSQHSDIQNPRRALAFIFGSVTSGHLVFASGAGGVTLQADSALPDLYRAHFAGHIPSVWAQNGMVTIQCGSEVGPKERKPHGHYLAQSLV